MGQETEYQLADAVVVQGEEPGKAGVFNTPQPFNGQQAPVGAGKMGAKCCGSCCDMRRAVIIVNIVNLCVLVFGALGLLATTTYAQNADVDDDQMQQELDAITRIPQGALMGILALQGVITLVGIFGAVTFNHWMVLFTAIAYGLGLVGSIIIFDITAILYNGLFLYPHVYLFNEIRRGIMTKANYPIEEFSCCCV